LLAGLAAQFGLEVTDEQSLPDDREAIARGLQQALGTADVAVLSGGVSVGEFDFVTPALADAGLTVHFTRVAVKPGKPMTYASRGGKLVFALPGNPVSVYLTFHLFVLRAAARMMGLEPPLREVGARLGRDFSRRNTERVEYVPARLVGARVEPIEYHGSAHLTALTEADGFLIVPVGVGSMVAGEPVAFAPRVKGWQ
jgi:molybdopterin molybdotransferase